MKRPVRPPIALIRWVMVTLTCYAGPTPLLAQCEVQELSALDTAEFGGFGAALGLDGNLAVVGAPFTACAPDARWCGAAYIHRYDGLTWNAQHKLTASDIRGEDRFGRAVSVSIDRVVVGAPFQDCGNGEDCGAAYVYRPSDEVPEQWVLEQKLAPVELAAYDYFGTSVSISGNVAIVGASSDDCDTIGSHCGSAYVYRFNGAGWAQEQRLTATDPGNSDYFGESVSISGNHAVVGSRFRACIAGNSCGAAFAFGYNGSTWVQEAEFAPPDVPPQSGFGTSVSIYRDVIVAGAPGVPCNAGSRCGAVYVFRLVGTSWVDEQKLYASDAASAGGLGSSVSVSEGVAVATAPGTAGAYVYRFHPKTRSWIEEQKLTHFRDGYGVQSGYASVSSDSVFVGDPNHCAPHACGFAYVFALGPDCNENDQADFCDIREGDSDDADSDGVPDECETIVATLDIKPGACPNVVNPKARGVLTVVLAGDEAIDVTQVDTGSLALQRADGVGGAAGPNYGPRGPGLHIADVATPAGAAACECAADGPDGIDDLVLRFDMAELSDVLELGGLAAGTSVTLKLTGALDDGTPFGTRFEASDCIVVPGAVQRPLSIDSPHFVAPTDSSQATGKP